MAGAALQWRRGVDPDADDPVRRANARTEPAGLRWGLRRGGELRRGRQRWRWQRKGGGEPGGLRARVLLHVRRHVLGGAANNVTGGGSGNSGGSSHQWFMSDSWCFQVVATAAGRLHAAAHLVEMSDEQQEYAAERTAGKYTSADQCEDGKFDPSINFCSEWCNQFGLFNCGDGLVSASDSRNTENVDYTCNSA